MEPVRELWNCANGLWKRERAQWVAALPQQEGLPEQEDGPR